LDSRETGFKFNEKFVEFAVLKPDSDSVKSAGIPFYVQNNDTLDHACSSGPFNLLRESENWKPVSLWNWAQIC